VGWKLQILQVEHGLSEGVYVTRNITVFYNKHGELSVHHRAWKCSLKDITNIISVVHCLTIVSIQLFVLLVIVEIGCGKITYDLAELKTLYVQL